MEPTSDEKRYPADPAADPARERARAILRALATYQRKLARKLDAVRSDLDEARRAGEFRRAGEALLTYLKQVPARTTTVSLPDPTDHDHTLDIALDPMVKPQVNAARYFKRAAKAERGMQEIPPRLAALESLIASLATLIDRIDLALDPSVGTGPLDGALVTEMEQAFDRMPPAARKQAGVPPLRGGPGSAAPAAIAGSGAAQTDVAQVAQSKGGMKRDQDLPSKLQPRRLKTSEGWDVLIGRNNEGNDYLTLHLARPEDYWFHVHGTPGSHVVLRRGKGKNEPSKQTLLEVAAWTAFYSKSATAGTVPVIYTLKKYVRKPRKAPAGTVMCEREKTLMVKPQEPGREALADEGG